jgi:hypothetical protein
MEVVGVAANGEASERALTPAGRFAQRIEAECDSRLEEAADTVGSAVAARSAAIEVVCPRHGASAALKLSAGASQKVVRLTVPAGHVRAVVDGEAGALELIAALYTNAGDSSYAARWRPHRIGNGVPDVGEIIDGVHGAHKPPPCQGRLWNALNVPNGAARIEGRSGSGKTTLVRALSAQWLNDAREPGGLVSLDLIDPNDGDESVVLALLGTPRHSRYLVVMDNTQANLRMARRVFALVGRLREQLDMNISVLAAGWLGSDARDVGFPGRIATYSTDAGFVLSQLLAGRHESRQIERAIRELANGDLIMADFAIRYFHGDPGVPVRGIPTREQFIAWIAAKLRLDELSDSQVRRTLYEYACLTMFEIDIPRLHVTQRLVRRELERLEMLGLIESADTSYRVRSRSVAMVIAQYALTRWSEPKSPGGPYPSPAEVATNFLTFAGDRQIDATLDKVDLLRVTMHGVDPGSRFLATALQQRKRIAQRLRTQTRIDPNWGENAACAAMACVAVAKLGDADAWERYAEMVRRYWHCGAGDLPQCNRATPTAEYGDFERIRAAMAVADASEAAQRGEHDAPAWPEHLTARGLDLDTAHRTWMLGILLSFEGTALVPDHDRLQRLYQAAQRAQQDDGQFYPERVPWITARILIGLHDAGYGTTETARRAATWLRERGIRDVGWRSGTVEWSGDLMATAFCLVALRLYGLQDNDTVVEAGYAALSANQLTAAEVTAPIDRALTAQALLLGDDRSRWPEAYEIILSLLEWVVSLPHWTAESAVGNAVQSNGNGSGNGNGNGARPVVRSGPRTAEEFRVAAPARYEDSTEIPLVISVLMDCVSKAALTELRPLFADLERLATGGATNQLYTADAVSTAAAPDAASSASSADPADPAAAQSADGQPRSRQSPPGLDRTVLLRVDENLVLIGSEIKERIESNQAASRGRRLSESIRVLQNARDELRRYQQQHRSYHLLAQDGDVDEALCRAIDELGYKVVDPYDPILPPHSPETE